MNAIEEKYAKELITLDGKPLSRDLWASIFVILSRCPMQRMEVLDKSHPGLMQTFVTITDRFICANTYEDIDSFIHHNLTVELLNRIFG